MHNAPHYLTVAKVAAHVGLTVPTVLAHIHCGDLIASNVSSGTQRPCWRIASDELTRWLTSRENGPRITRRRRHTAAITEYV